MYVQIYISTYIHTYIHANAPFPPLPYHPQRRDGIKKNGQKTTLRYRPNALRSSQKPASGVLSRLTSSRVNFRGTSWMRTSSLTFMIMPAKCGSTGWKTTWFLFLRPRARRAPRAVAGRPMAERCSVMRKYDMVGVLSCPALGWVGFCCVGVSVVAWRGVERSRVEWSVVWSVECGVERQTVRWACLLRILAPGACHCVRVFLGVLVLLLFFLQDLESKVSVGLGQLVRFSRCDLLVNSLLRASLTRSRSCVHILPFLLDLVACMD